MNSLRRIRQLCRRSPQQGYSTARQQAVVRRLLLIRDCYYAINLVAAFFMANVLWLRVQEASTPIPHWPVFWATPENLRATAAGVILLLLAAAVLAVLNPRSPLFRMAVALGSLLTFALYNSFGSMSHGGHIWTWMAVLFTLFPAGRDEDILASRVLRMRMIWTYLAAQGLVLLFYSMSGWYKLASAIPRSPEAISSLSPYALSAHVTRFLGGDTSATLTGALVMNYPWLVWPIFLAVIYVELFALVAWFRPSLQPLFGAFLLCFHIGIWMTMGIHFLLQPVQMLLLLVWAPFVTQPLSRASLQQALRDLPGIGLAAQATTGLRQMQFLLKREMAMLGLLAGMVALLYAGRYIGAFLRS